MHPLRPLENVNVLSLAVNLPGPLAVAELVKLGASVVKIEPPGGDPLAAAKPHWYQRLHLGQEIHRLNVKEAGGRTKLTTCLGQAELLITAMRPAALERLGLSWPDLQVEYPQLCQVAIVGYSAPYENQPGHDLVYQARAGLLAPPQMPRSCVADFGGAQAAVGAALALLLARERGQGCRYTEVRLADAADFFAEPLRQGLTDPSGILGGSAPGYGLYRAEIGWIAVAALEPHFWRLLTEELGLDSPDRADLEAVFLTRTAQAWEKWALERGLPIAEVRDTPE